MVVLNQSNNQRRMMIINDDDDRDEDGRGNDPKQSPPYKWFWSTSSNHHDQSSPSRHHPISNGCSKILEPSSSSSSSFIKDSSTTTTATKLLSSSSSSTYHLHSSTVSTIVFTPVFRLNHLPLPLSHHHHHHFHPHLAQVTNNKMPNSSETRSSSSSSCSLSCTTSRRKISTVPIATKLLLIFLATTTIIMDSTDARQVILLDTTQETSLDWTRLPHGPQARTPGWVEESFTNFEQGINWRSYVVCDVAYNNVNNWLWTPFIERHNANRMYIEIKFSMRDCNLFPGMALSCKETFSLLYYEHDGLNKEPPPWEPDSYKLIDRIAADEGRFTSNSEVIINTEIRSVPVTKKGVYFAFRDQGACLSIIAIKIFYITCPNITTNFAFYPETPTGRELTTIVETDGVCVANAQQVEIPRLLCKGDGNWTLPSGGCKCMAGFEPVGQSCQVCPAGKFKPNVGDDPCKPCPAHSKSSYHGSTECRCDIGYYRSPKDPKWMPCTQPPSAPQNLSISFMDQSTVKLTWLPPRYQGGRDDTVYRVVCDYCPPTTQYVPSSENINDTKVIISGLNPMTAYRFQVYAENGVSGYDTSQFAEISATTEASGYISLVITEDSSGQKYNAIPTTTIYPPTLRITSADGTMVSLAWKRNPNDSGNNNNGGEPSSASASMQNPSQEITAFELRYHSIDYDRNATTILLPKDQFETTITGLKPQTEYSFQIRSRTKTGWSEYSKPVIKMTGQRLANPAYISGDNESVQTRIIIVGVILLIILITFIISLVLFYLKRNSEDCNKKQPSDCDTLEYRSCGMEGKKLVSAFDHHAPIVPTPRFNSTFSVATPLFTNCATSRSYVDPHTYEDPNQAVKEFTKEIDASHITIEAIIGGGEFGDVCRGKLKVPGKSEVTVAIKTLKPTTAEKPRLDFLTEASIMGQFEHANVIYLQGVVTKTNPIMIITEYMEHGSLDAFLRANEGKFTILQLIGMLRGIASGMEYLSTMNYVHRDLAARNVLVNSSFICKIADFGLSREIESATEGAYTTRGGKIPVRWTAPEAIAFRKFTSASDVWSFGIVCWEVMSYGERPYWNWSNQDVIKSIEKGYRLPPPIDCPDAVYQLMLESWQKDRSNRPTFTQIVKTLDKLAKCPENLMKLAQQMTRLDPFIDQPQPAQQQASIPDVIQFKSFYEWLASIKMSRYQINFEHAGINSLPAVARLGLQDLSAIGIEIPSHQKKIMSSIYALRAQNSIGSPEGFLNQMLNTAEQLPEQQPEQQHFSRFATVQATSKHSQNRRQSQSSSNSNNIRKGKSSLSSSSTLLYSSATTSDSSSSCQIHYPFY